MAEIFENEAVRTERELYKSVNVYGKIFDLYYGYYEATFSIKNCRMKLKEKLPE